VAKARKGNKQGLAGPRAADAGGAGRRTPDKDVHLASLEQMKVLADRRRIRILELLSEERTTKQVAEILGEPPTRLYHHVAALERVGLIRLARTRPSRGALEKYFVAVAKTFSADSKLFTTGGGPATSDAKSIVTQFLELTADDLRALLEGDESAEVVKEEGLLSYLEVRATPRELKAIRTKLSKLIEGVTAAGASADRRDERAYRLTIAFFPLARRSPPA
jgi:DNA-binding transcriptional ArsR family regulator